MIRPTQILILSHNPGQVRRWTVILADTARVWQAAADVPPDMLPEVIVTDLPILHEADLPHEALRRALHAAEVGVVAIGTGAPADVRLPVDFRPRELQLVCPLLAEAVRWRRECHRARQLQQTFSQLASTDALTGLPNRRAWEEEVRVRSTRHNSEQGSLCLALFDVDHFKAINDHFGHIAGDEVLCHIGRGLARGRRDSDYVARLGGDEFVLLLEGRDPQSAAADVESLRAGACQDAPHAQVTACVGFAFAQTMPPDGLNALFESADIALRVAKQSGRNRTVSTGAEQTCMEL
jgi:diguanylate cyclase (GGDEF)-like protein